MTLIKKTSDYKIFKRGDGRFAVQDATGKPVNGEEKVKILLAEDLIKVSVPAEPEPEAEAETAEAADAAEDAPEADAGDEGDLDEAAAG